MEQNENPSSLGDSLASRHLQQRTAEPRAGRKAQRNVLWFQVGWDHSTPFCKTEGQSAKQERGTALAPNPPGSPEQQGTWVCKWVVFPCCLWRLCDRDQRERGIYEVGGKDNLKGIPPLPSRPREERTLVPHSAVHLGRWGGVNGSAFQCLWLPATTNRKMY